MGVRTTGWNNLCRELCGKQPEPPAWDLRVHPCLQNNTGERGWKGWDAGREGEAREQRQLMGMESLKMVAVLAKQVFSFSFLNVFP